jgi:hypothetical protein
MLAGENGADEPILMFESPDGVHVTLSAAFSKSEKRSVEVLGGAEAVVEGTVQPKAGMIVELRDSELDYEATNAALESGMQAMMDAVRRELK